MDDFADMFDSRENSELGRLRAEYPTHHVFMEHYDVMARQAYWAAKAAQLGNQPYYVVRPSMDALRAELEAGRRG